MSSLEVKKIMGAEHRATGNEGTKFNLVKVAKRTRDV